MALVGRHDNLSAPAADAYALTSAWTFSLGVISWSQYLDRLYFLRKHADPDSLHAKVATEVFEKYAAEFEDHWALGEPLQPRLDEDELDISRYAPLEHLSPPIYFVAPPSTGLTRWVFHLTDADFFPSIPHGHDRHGKRDKLDAYRGFIYKNDEQIGREPRCKIVALWNEADFRSFASSAITYYMTTFPEYSWPVAHPLKLPRNRK